MLPEQSSPAFWERMEVIFDKKFEEYDKNKAKVRHEEVFNTISSHKKEIDAVKKQFSELSDKISVLEQIDNFKDAQLSAETLKAIKDSIAVLQSKFECQAKNDDNFKRYSFFQNSCREQRSRSWSLRVTNFQSPHSREKITMLSIYNTLILPSLKIAHRNGLLDFVPQYWGDVIEYAHHLPFNPKRKEVPQAIFRFHSRVHLQAVMISKRPVLEEYTAKLNQYKTASQSVSPAPYFPGRMIKMQYDTTRLNKNVQTFLHSTKLISRTKIMGESVGFQIKTGTRWQKVLNPFADTLIGMTRPIPGTENLFSTSMEPPLIKYNSVPYADRGSFFPNSKFCNPLITEDDFEDNYEPPPNAANTDEFPPLESATTSDTAAADVPEAEDENAAEQMPAPTTAPSVAAAAPATSAARPAAREPDSDPPKQQPPPPQKSMPARTAKKTNDSKIK